MVIRGILFDKDGTLVDFNSTWVPLNLEAALVAARGDSALAKRLLARGGYQVDRHRFTSGSLLAAGSAREIAEAWVAAGAPWIASRLETEINHLFARSAEMAVPTTDLSVLFGHLAARGLALGVATTDSEVAARGLLKRLAQDGKVSFVAGYDSGYGCKPDPAVVHAFAERAEVTASTIMVVGDSPQDAWMGRAAGCAYAVGVTTGTSTGAELRDSFDEVLESIAALVGVLDRLAPQRPVSGWPSRGP